MPVQRMSASSHEGVRFPNQVNQRSYADGRSASIWSTRSDAERFRLHFASLSLGLGYDVESAPTLRKRLFGLLRRLTLLGGGDVRGGGVRLQVGVIRRRRGRLAFAAHPTSWTWMPMPTTTAVRMSTTTTMRMPHALVQNA